MAGNIIGQLVSGSELDRIVHDLSDYESDTSSLFSYDGASDAGETSDSEDSTHEVRPMQNMEIDANPGDSTDLNQPEAGDNQENISRHNIIENV